MLASLKILAQVLPRIAEEGHDHEVRSEEELVRCLAAEGLDQPSAAISVAILRRLLLLTSCLDEADARKGRWRFVSFPAYLFARSVISGACGADYRLLERGFWESPRQNAGRQHDLLHRIELIRGASESAALQEAIRRVWVAWSIILVDGKFLLVAREDDKPERADTMGSFVFPGGRVAPGDLMEDSLSRRLDFFDPAVPITFDEAESPLARALLRELKEELDLDRSDLLVTETAGTVISFRTLEGSNAAHALTDYYLQVFRIESSSRGKQALLTRLAERSDQFAWFSRDELQTKKNASGKTAFVDALLADPRAGGEVLHAHSRFEMNFGDDEPGREEVDVPVGAEDRFVIGETSRERDIPFDLSERERGILAFFVAARRSERTAELAQEIKVVPELGWVIIDDPSLLRECREFATRLYKAFAPWKPLAFEGNAVRLNVQRPQLAYFGASAFSLRVSPIRSGERYELSLCRASISSPLGRFVERTEVHVAARKLGQGIHQLAAGDLNFALEHWGSLKRLAQNLTLFSNQMGLRRMLRQQDGVPVLAVGALRAD